MLLARIRDYFVRNDEVYLHNIAHVSCRYMYNNRVVDTLVRSVLCVHDSTVVDVFFCISELSLMSYDCSFVLFSVIGVLLHCHHVHDVFHRQNIV